VPRGAGELKVLAAGLPKSTWPSALKKIVAAMIATSSKAACDSKFSPSRYQE